MARGSQYDAAPSGNGRGRRIAKIASVSAMLFGASYAFDACGNDYQVNKEITGVFMDKTGWGVAPAAAPAQKPARAVRTKPVVFLDPGHSGKKIDRIDTATGLHDGDYGNSPEMQEVWDVSLYVKARLEKDGYAVAMAKKSVHDSVFLRDRATAADKSNAAIAVSIHNDHSADNTWGAVFAQVVGSYRGGGVHNKVTYHDAATAAKSQRFAQTIAQSRSKAQGINTVVKQNSFDGRGQIEPGNIPLVELFSKTPWVYCETGAKQGFSQAQEVAYGNGIVAGIEQAVPIAAAAN